MGGGTKVDSGWKADKRWSDRFLPEIKGILGLHLIGEPPMEEDAERNTDLMVLRMEAVRIGCRVRRFDAYCRWPKEFTIRAGRPSGVKTELTKIIEGWGDYLFYGFSDNEERRLCAWTLADLKVFRRWFNAQLFESDRRVSPGSRHKNTDGSSDFNAFKWHDLPPEFIMAKSQSEVGATA